MRDPLEIAVCLLEDERKPLPITPEIRRRFQKRLENAESDDHVRRVVRDAARYGVDWSHHLPESLSTYTGTPPSKTGATLPQDMKRNPNFRKPKTGSRGDGFYRDGSLENSARIKDEDGSVM